MREVQPREFEYFVAYLVDEVGFRNVEVTPRSGDGGRDIVAVKNINGIPLIFSFKCKQYKPDNKIRLDTMRALLGTVTHDRTKSNIGVLVTTSYFTKGSREFILSEPSIDGKDFDDVVKWINDLKGSGK